MRLVLALLVALVPAAALAQGAVGTPGYRYQQLNLDGPINCGSGKICDASGLTVTPSSAAAGNTLAKLFSGLAPIASPAFTGTATFAARPTFAGATPWDSGNLTPSLLAPLASPVFTGTATAPKLAITGTGSTGDVSGMTVTPSASAGAGTLAKLVADRAPLASPTFTGTAAFTARPIFAGATPWDSYNLDPTLYAPLASPTFTGSATFAARPTFAGATPWDSANLNPSLYAPLASPTFTGAASSPQFVSGAKAGITVTDLHSNPPTGGYYAISGTGAEFSVCPQGGCDVNRDIIRGQFYLRGQSKADVTHAESQVILDNYINTGLPPTWHTSTAYSLGTIVANNNKLFQVAVAGTSASSGTGPTVADPNNRGASVTDGSITWTYISGQDDTDNKATLSVGTVVGTGASRVWGTVSNMLVYAGWVGQTAIASEEDMSLLGPGDCNPRANCFLKFLYANGPGTGTALLQISSAGDVTPIASDGGSGGATKYGINIDGVNTVRDIAFSEGTNASISYKSWGNHRIAVLQDVGTSPIALDLGGTYATAILKSGGLMLGNWGGDGTGGYKALSFNGTLASGALAGLFGKSGDPTLYMNGPSLVEVRSGGATVLQMNNAKVTSYVPTYHYAVGALPGSPVEGDCAWDSAVHKLKCHDGTAWNAAW